MVYALTLSLVRPADADDVAQEAFIRAFRNLDLLADPSRFGVWLRRITFGVAIDHVRADRTPSTSIVPLEGAENPMDSGVGLVDPGPSPLERLEHATRSTLERLSASTTPDTRLLDAALQVDWGMHNLIVESVGNPILTAAHQQNFDKIRMIRLHGRSPRYLPLAMEEHLAVLEAMRCRDAPAAAAALKEHLGCAERRALGL